MAPTILSLRIDPRRRGDDRRGRRMNKIYIFTKVIRLKFALSLAPRNINDARTTEVHSKGLRDVNHRIAEKVKMQTYFAKAYA